MRVTLDQSLPFQQNEHCPNRAGIRRHTAGEFPLGQGVTPCERRQKHELVGSHPLSR